MRILISRDFVSCVSKLYLGLQLCAFDSVEEILMAKAAMRVQQIMRLRGQRLTYLSMLSTPATCFNPLVT